MNISEKVFRPITEAKYLNADNAVRYRCIMRIFYENYEKLRYMLYQEDVYEEMIKHPYFEDYRMEQCQQDLAMLTEWKNLSATQDTRNVATLEEFKNKRFRYQMSEYSVEIERFIEHLENLHIEGSSLEPSLLERIRRNISRFEEMANVQGEEIYRWWTDLNTDFVRLNQNYQDYVRELNGIRAEELMKTKEFLIFKDKLIEYLRSFIKGLQQNVGIIEELFQGVTPEIRDKIFLNLIEYQKSIPRTDVQNAEETEKMYEQMIRERYQNIYNWFCSGNETENEAVKIFDTTNEIIRRITRYAAQMSEKNSIGSNRREEYRKVAEIFMKCKTEDEAHCMAAMVFGLERPCHIEGELIRETDSMNQGVYEETPMHFTLKPRIRNYREKSKRSGIREMSKEKQEMRQRILQQQKEELAKIRSLEIEGRIDFSNLPVLEAREREILLKWLSDVMESTDFTARTEDGRKYTLDRSRMSEQCKVYCTDGIFTMPCFSFVFLEEES